MAKKTVAKPAEPINFEQSLNALEQLVERMEQGELPLEEALRQFERGIELTRICQTTLAAAEQRVEILLEKNGQLQTMPFEHSQHSASDTDND